MKFLLIMYFILILLAVKSLATEVIYMDYDDVMYGEIQVYNYNTIEDDEHGCECW